MNNTQFLTNALIIIPFRFPISRPANYELQTAKHLAQHNTVIACAMHEATPLWRFILHPYQVLYLDPLGGYTAMTFTEVNIGMDVQKDEIKTHKGVS